MGRANAHAVVASPRALDARDTQPPKGTISTGRRWTTWLALATWLGASAVLVVRGRAFDFICDDAFIVFRYARNWVDHGEIAYNLGERVEGYTSPAWLVLVALGFKLGSSEHQVVALLGTASVALLVAGALALWRELEPGEHLTGAAVVAATAASAPLAAWAFAGLETPLYAALVVVSLLAGARALARDVNWRWFATGVSVAATTLARPEGAVLLAGFALSAFAASMPRARAVRAVGAMTAGFCVLVVPFLLWRLSYYGSVVPNTYLVKTSGDAFELFKRGLKYLVFAQRDMGVWLCLAGVLLLFAPFDARKEARPGADGVLLTVRVFAVITIAHVARIGGDFLEAYRFLVPLLVPVALCAAARAIELLRRAARVRPAARTAGLGVLALVTAYYVVHDLRWAALVRTTTDSRHTAAWLESIPWTRTYALRWAAMGRWLRAHARPGDTMAVGAAGAMPYYANLPSLDVLGLCSREVALHGDVSDPRPGHQRHATQAQIRAYAPVFLFDGDRDADQPTQPKRRDVWEAGGYVWMEATVSPDKYGAGIAQPFYYYVLVRADRAAAVEAAGDARRVTSVPE